MATKEGLKIHEVVKYPDPVLKQPGEPITVFDDALKKLVAEMFESMYAAQGIGLAAPQIGISQAPYCDRRQLQEGPEGQAGADQSGDHRDSGASRLRKKAA